MGGGGGVWVCVFMSWVVAAAWGGGGGRTRKCLERIEEKLGQAFALVRAGRQAETLADVDFQAGQQFQPVPGSRRRRRGGRRRCRRAEQEPDAAGAGGAAGGRPARRRTFARKSSAGIGRGRVDAGAALEERAQFRVALAGDELGDDRRRVAFGQQPPHEQELEQMAKTVTRLAALAGVFVEQTLADDSGAPAGR